VRTMGMVSLGKLSHDSSLNMWTSKFRDFSQIIQGHTTAKRWRVGLD
jgi:hypothetical protein